MKYPKPHVQHKRWSHMKQRYVLRGGVGKDGTIVYPSNFDASVVSVIATDKAIANYNKAWLLAGKYPGDADMPAIQQLWGDLEIERYG